MRNRITNSHTMFLLKWQTWLKVVCENKPGSSFPITFTERTLDISYQSYFSTCVSQNLFRDFFFKLFLTNLKRQNSCFWLFFHWLKDTGINKKYASQNIISAPTWCVELHVLFRGIKKQSKFIYFLTFYEIKHKIECKHKQICCGSKSTSLDLCLDRNLYIFAQLCCSYDL